MSGENEPIEHQEAVSAAGRAHRLHGLALGIIMFVLGACGLAYEYTFSKLASDLLGNSVQQWAIVIALMLFAMGLGAEVQRHISRERLADSLVGSQIVLALLGAFGPLALLYVFAWQPTHFSLLQYGITLAVGVLIGLEIPLIVRLNEQFAPDVRLNLARILKMDYVGALFGALLWVFLLVRYFSVTETAFVLGLTTLFTSALCIMLYRPQLRSERTSITLLALAAVGCIAGLARAERITLHAEQSLFRDRIVFATTTRYQHIVFTEGANGRRNCYINGNLQFSSEDEFIYHENLVHPAMSIAPRRDRVLILGGGDGLALREVLKYPDVREVVLVDIDPEMTRLARENEWLRQLNGDSLREARVTTLEDHTTQPGETVEIQQADTKVRPTRAPEVVAQVQVLNLDAAAFVRQASGRFNVAIIDFPDPNSPDLAKLYSQPFYMALRERLAADGIFIQQSTSPVHAKEAFLCIGRTMAAAGFSVVPLHDNVPTFGEWGWWLGGAETLYSPARLQQLIAAETELPVPTRYLTAELMRASLAFGKGQLETQETAITTQTESSILSYYLQAWENLR